MANIKVTELTELTALTANDVFYVVDSETGASRKVKASVFRRPYKVYSASVTTDLETLGTVTELENTLGTVTPSYVGKGNIRFSTSELFTNNKTAVLITPGTRSEHDNDVTVRYVISSTSAIDVYTAVDGTDTDDLLVKSTIEIRVYD